MINLKEKGVLMQIYMDISLLLNFGTNALLLWFTGLISGTPIKKWRFLSGTLLGVIMSLAFFIVDYQLQLWVKLIFLIGILCVTFPVHSLNHFIVIISVFLLLSFFLGGMIYASLNVVPTSNSAGTSLEFFSVLKELVIGFAVIFVFYRRIVQIAINKQRIFDVEILNTGTAIKLRGFLDTGNQLYTSLCGYPVIIVEKDFLKKILSKEVQEFLDLYSSDMWISNLQLCRDQQWCNHIYLIQYQGITNKNLLLGFKPDKIKIQTRSGENISGSSVVVGIYGGKLNINNDYQALLHESFLNYF